MNLRSVSRYSNLCCGCSCRGSLSRCRRCLCCGCGSLGRSGGCLCCRSCCSSLGCGRSYSCFCCRSRCGFTRLIQTSFLEVAIQQTCPVVAHVLITSFVRVYTVIEICLIINNAVDIGKPDGFTFALHLQNQIVNRSVVCINAACYRFHQLLLFFIGATPCANAISTQPVCTQNGINIRNGGDKDNAVFIHIFQNDVDQIFQTVGNAIVVITQDIICTNLQQDDVRFIRSNHVLAVVVSTLNGFQNARTVFL